MEKAIVAARHCQPANPALTPRVGALIVKDDTVLAEGHRGKSDHAEFDAFGKVADKTALIGATLYTTLEPCTGAVRRDPSIACTNLVIQHKIRKVYIGMLDPNQEVCGKGVLALQKHNIEVALFDHDLATEIGALNVEFVRSQQSLGVQILTPGEGEHLQTYKTEGRHVFRCKTFNPPGTETRVVVARNGQWWPQVGKLTRVGSTDEYDFTVHFGAYGLHEVHVVKLSELGVLLFEYYKNVATRNTDRRRRVMDKYPVVPSEIFWGDYTGIPLSSPPRGLDIQASVSVIVDEPPPSV